MFTTSPTIGLALIPNNYRPVVSNLSFVSKLIENGIVLKLVDHIKGTNLFKKCQSVYTEGRSTESTLPRVQNYILMAMNYQ